MAVGQKQSGLTEPVLLLSFPFFLPHFILIPEGVAVVQTFPVDLAVLGVGAVVEGHFRNTPILFTGQQSSVSAGKVESGIGESFKELINAVKGSCTEIFFSRISPGNKDLIAPGGDNISVTVDFFQVDLTGGGKGFVADAQKGHIFGSGELVHDFDRGSCDFSKQLRKFFSCVFHGIIGVGGNVDLKLHLALFNESQGSFAQLAEAGTFRFRGELRCGAEEKKRQCSQQQ